MFKNKKVLVAGGTGMLGKQLVKMLVEEDAKIRIASLMTRAEPILKQNL